MTVFSRRSILSGGLALVSLAGTAPQLVWAQGSGEGFMAASDAMGGPDAGPKTPGIQRISALCEVTGGGEKV